MLDGTLKFDLFAKNTSTLLLGSRDGSTKHSSLNIATILNKCDKQYPGLEKLYAILSESAHPNYEGMVTGYSTFDGETFETCFSNRWMQIYGRSHIGSMELCIMTFEREYNDVWVELMGKLESWIVENDDELEATKNAATRDK